MKNEFESEGKGGWFGARAECGSASGRGRMMENSNENPKPLVRLKNSLTHGNIWLSILSLMKSRKVYAYALPSEIKKKFGFEPSKLMAYFVLYKLEAEGLISAKFEGRRKYYELLPKGRDALENAKHELFSLSKRL